MVEVARSGLQAVIKKNDDDYLLRLNENKNIGFAFIAA